MSEQIISSIISGAIAIISIISSACVAIFIPCILYRKQKIFDKQLEVLVGLYQKIEKTRLSAELYMNPLNRSINQQNALRKRVESDFNNMSEFFLQNKILIPKTISDHVDNLIVNVHGNIADYEAAKNGESAGAQDVTEMNNIWTEQTDGEIKRIADGLNELIVNAVGIKVSRGNGK